MKKQTNALRAGLATAVALAALALAGQAGASARVAYADTPPALECEGTACAQVTVTFDEQKQQYRVHNNSTDTYVRVSASNLSASAEACVAPGKDAYLLLKGITGPYRADSEGSSCGSADGT
ncbi:MAG TPA: hypothetical protein VE642_03305 [Pyrinomonadaceae bacterium]|nr:hypothetical protein [Pyrinomonadaceae bacterium]